MPFDPSSALPPLQSSTSTLIAPFYFASIGKVIYSTEPKQRDVSFQFNDTGDLSQRHYYYVRLQQDDRMTAWSSPMFVNYK